MPSPRPVQKPAGQQPGEQLHGVLEPIVTAAGFELDQLDVRAIGRRHTIKLVVDSDAGVGLDDIALVSRAASEELDKHEHLIGGSYTLEVTSPGVDRPLTSPRHWRRAHLRLVAVRPQDGAPFTGRVGSAGEESVELLVGGARRTLRYADVAHAAVEVEFSKPPASEIEALQGTETTQEGSR
ncbi:ribosome maturation factor RimP [Pseudonocardia sp.]|jgi:ribosome maturation factor RimP|uniref:ribosome maturation factor RimP n=1 Tax=Pseudonocardia sp. TaxID=60912 RepID=UPI00260D1FCA|nr:ribosome maturation factor RimP [Pseudonocardia sp.]MCW2721872.1 Ribosome maturation factor rimP [Pseudonocardia sp.]MDT7613787.1 ribosome maturation factor RimP [Pseudonocardiales bacterium]